VRPAVYLDAFTLACPPPEAGIESFGSYIQNLLNWSALRRTEWIDIYTSRKTSEVLFEVGAYPPWPELKRAINYLGIQHVQVKDIVEIVNGFLQRTSLVENELGIDDLLFDQYELVPAVDYAVRPGPFALHFELLTILLALHKSLYEELSNPLLLSSPDLKHHGKTRVTATLLEVACSSSSVAVAACRAPYTVSAQFAICICLHSLHMSVDACGIWSSSTCYEAMRKAIEVFAYQQNPSGFEYFNILENHPFSFGQNFIGSSRASGFFDDPRKIRMLLRACVESILETNLRAVHALRVDRGNESVQITRGTDKAWRRDIDHEYHLHYWETENGFELADVVHHKDFRITF
jgi:hypothetical protein